MRRESLASPKTNEEYQPALADAADQGCLRKILYESSNAEPVGDSPLPTTQASSLVSAILSAASGAIVGFLVAGDFLVPVVLIELSAASAFIGWWARGMISN